MLNRMLSGGADLTGEVFRFSGTPDRPLVYVLTQIIHHNGLLAIAIYAGVFISCPHQSFQSSLIPIPLSTNFFD
jgi:hypothetical protein